MRLVRLAFVTTLALSLVGGLLFLAAQVVAIVAGQAAWLAVLNETVKIPVVVSSSLCAIFAFLLLYSRHGDTEATTEASDEPV